MKLNLDKLRNTLRTTLIDIWEYVIPIWKISGLFKRIKSNELVVKAAELMKEYKVYTLVVEENKKVVGILTMHDILEANVL